jgi:TPR repeat protein
VEAEKAGRLTMRRFALESDVSAATLFGTPPKPPLWPERHPFHWLDSAEKGNVEAMLKLGAIYERCGENDKSVEWYQKAALEGSDEGKQKLEMMRTRFTSPGNPK